MMIYFTSNPNMGILGSYLEGGFIRINLDPHYYFAAWTNIHVYNVFSTLMHEVGHRFGINGDGQTTDPDGDNPETGDTTMKRRSVMDYYYARFGYGAYFDQGHMDTIALNIENYVL